MRVILQFVVLILLLTACNRRDARVRDRIVGTWVLRDAGEITLFKNGSWHSHWANATDEWIYDGTWEIKDGVLVSTLTNSSASSGTNLEAIGSIDHFKIIQLDNAHLALDVGGQTNLFTRR